MQSDMGQRRPSLAEGIVYFQRLPGRRLSQMKSLPVWNYSTQGEQGVRV